MSKFWQKKYTSKYTGAEIDAAVAKAGTVPTVTEADAGKALVVDEEGKIVAGEVGGGDPVVLDLATNLMIALAMKNLQGTTDDAKHINVGGATFEALREVFAPFVNAIIANPKNPNVVVLCGQTSTPIYCKLLNTIVWDQSTDVYNVFFSFAYQDVNGTDTKIFTYTYYVNVNQWGDTDNESFTTYCQTKVDEISS